MSILLFLNYIYRRHLLTMLTLALVTPLGNLWVYPSVKHTLY